MTIAVLGWGSLIWSPRELPLRGSWSPDGPALPIEFSRISPDGRLTLAVDPVAGAPVVTMWALSASETTNDAVRDLARREGCVERWIGYAEPATGEASCHQFPEQVDVSRDVLAWCEDARFDGVVWTALPVTFAERTGRPFTVARALDYLRSLKGERRSTALEYVRRAPDVVDTPVRRAFARDLRLSG